MKSPVLSLATLVLVACLANCSTAGAPYVLPPVHESTDRGVSQPLATSGFESLYSFKGKRDGSLPIAPPATLERQAVRDNANSSGTADRGTVFEIDTSGQERVLYSFHGFETVPVHLLGYSQ